MIVNEYGEIDMEKLKNTLKLIDRPFYADIWQSSIKEGGDVFGRYMKNLALNFKQDKWNDYIDNSNNIEKFNTNLNNDDIDKLKDKYGYGYSDEEYQAFERKYQMLKNNYPEKTAMHTEALLTYIRYRVKEEMATAKGDVKEAKAWGELASKAAQDAKINPSQLSRADLTDGLNTFGELTRAVEQAVDIIPILPKFKERPQDKVDFTIWCYINYIRDLKGLPLCEYKEIYKFYEERKKNMNNMFLNMTIYLKMMMKKIMKMELIHNAII